MSDTLSAPRVNIGVTGGIGSGKSTVAAMLETLGGQLIDIDGLSKSLTLPGGAAIPALRAAFGSAIVDDLGAVDRTKLRTWAFADAQAKAQLESILHPLIRSEAERLAARLGPQGPVIFDIPLLVESAQWRAGMDLIVVVDCWETTQIDRVTKRSGWTADAAHTVIRQQASRDARRSAADAVVFNDGLTLEELRTEVVSLWQQWFAVEQSA